MDASCSLASIREESKTPSADQLTAQQWYWGDSTKELIASAMSGCDNGTFCVRDATTEGDCTLTVRCGEKNKLIKIIINGTRCGFGRDELKFSSVVELVEYYKRNSLNEYNRQLDVKLTCGLARPLERTIWETDGVHSIVHLLCQLRGLQAAHTRILRCDDHICMELDSLREELLRKRQAKSALSVAHSLFLKHTALISNNRHRVTTQTDMAHIDNNIEQQHRRLEAITKQQDTVHDHMDAIERRIADNEREHALLTPKLCKLHIELNRCQFRLCKLDVSQSTVDKELQQVSFLTDSEPEPLSRILMKFHLLWQPDRFLSDCTKERGMKIVRSLMDWNPTNADGIFVIRPSSSQLDHYALTISNDNRIYNCLIEHRDVKHPESCGFAFLNTKLFFPTLVDFVRYYSHCSMKEHNPQLNTRLKMPVFKGNL